MDPYEPEDEYEDEIPYEFDNPKEFYKNGMAQILIKNSTTRWNLMTTITTNNNRTILGR